MRDVDFTGERLIPGKADAHLLSEHYARYRFAGRFVSGRRALDLGCGVGYGCRFLRDANAKQVLGVDVAPDAVAHASRMYGHGISGYAVTDGRWLPFADGTFDVITCFEVLEHVADPEELVREARRVLSDSGILIASTPNRLTYSERSRGEPNPFHLHEMYRSEFMEMIEAHFADFDLYGQVSSEGILIQKEGVVEHGMLRPEPLGLTTNLGPEDRRENHEPDYFLAICHVRAGSSICEVGGFYLAPIDLFERLRQQVTEISFDLDEKRQWAMSLDAEVREREAQVLALQDDLQEKVGWARRLQAQVEEQERVIRSQKEIIESLWKGAGS